MIVIQFDKNTPIQQIEGFPLERDPDPKVKNDKGIRRSFKGSMHVHPGSTKQITQDEYEYLKLSGVKFSVLKNFEEKTLERKKQDKPVESNKKKEDENIIPVNINKN